VKIQNFTDDEVKITQRRKKLKAVINKLFIGILLLGKTEKCKKLQNA
jgi:hypothetical protein